MGHRCFQASWENSPLQHILGLPKGLLPAAHAWSTTPGGVQVRCLNHINWLWRCGGISALFWVRPLWLTSEGESGTLTTFGSAILFWCCPKPYQGTPEIGVGRRVDWPAALFSCWTLFKTADQYNIHSTNLSISHFTLPLLMNKTLGFLGQKLVLKTKWAPPLSSWEP